MRKKLLLISGILFIGAVSMTACGKKSPSSPEAETTTTEAATEDTKTEEETTVATAASTEATTEAVDQDDIATKEDEEKKPKNGSGTFNGWVDSKSVEIEMSNGEFKTLFVEEEEVKKALNEKGEGSKISFTYGALEGQANMQILSVK